MLTCLQICVVNCAHIHILLKELIKWTCKTILFAYFCKPFAHKKNKNSMHCCDEAFPCFRFKFRPIFSLQPIKFQPSRSCHPLKQPLLAGWATDENTFSCIEFKIIFFVVRKEFNEYQRGTEN